jgi:hypothetical protein
VSPEEIGAKLASAIRQAREEIQQEVQAKISRIAASERRRKGLLELKTTLEHIFADCPEVKVGEVKWVEGDSYQAPSWGMYVTSGSSSLLARALAGRFEDAVSFAAEADCSRSLFRRANDIAISSADTIVEICLGVAGRMIAEKEAAGACPS